MNSAARTDRQFSNRSYSGSGSSSPVLRESHSSDRQRLTQASLAPSRSPVAFLRPDLASMLTLSEWKSLAAVAQIHTGDGRILATDSFDPESSRSGRELRSLRIASARELAISLSSEPERGCELNSSTSDFTESNDVIQR